MHKVSVLIPNYNHASYLELRIESVLHQTYRSFEIIILDDNSIDDSKKIIEKYRGHPKVSHILYNSSNSGSAFKQWQKGIALAQGEYIWIAESDDWAEPDFLAQTVAVLDADKEVSLVYTQSYVADESSYILRTNNLWTDDLSKERWQHDFINSGRDECMNFLIKKNTIPNASAVLFRKEYLRDVKVWPLNFKMAGDWLFWIQLISSNKIAYLAKCLNYFRLSTQSTRNHNSFYKRRTRLVEELTVLYYNSALNAVPRQLVRKEYTRVVGKLHDLHIINRKYAALLTFYLSALNLKILFKIK